MGESKGRCPSGKGTCVVRYTVDTYVITYFISVLKWRIVIWYVHFLFIYFNQEKPKMFAKGTEINTTVVVKKLNEILQARGKKGTDR